MASKPPSFPFYGQDYQTGTMTMTPAERGAYVDCLWHQWAAGGVPADDMTRLAGAMRCSVSMARKLWPALASKFERGDDGLWRNPRLEKVRAEKQRYHDAQKGNGAKGGRPANPETQTKPMGFVSDNPRVPSGFPSSLSSVPNGTDNPSSGGHSGSRQIVSPAEYERLKKTNRFVGARLRIPHKLHGDFVASLGGSSPDAKLLAWYGTVDAEIEVSGEAILPDIWTWMRARFTPWALAQAPVVSDGYRPASEWIEQNRKDSEGSCSPEEARAILDAARAKMRPAVTHG